MNYERGQLHIKKRSFPQWLSLGVFALPFLLSGLIDLLGFPSVTKYVVDLMWVMLLSMMFLTKQVRIKKNITPLAVIVLLWFLYVVVGYVFNYQSIFYFLWGIRNNLRFYVAFIAFATFLEEDDAEKALGFADVLFWINVPVSLFQFYVQGHRQDYLGGIFGVERGCNAFTTILFVLVITKSLIHNFESKENIWICIVKCGFSLILAAMAELKFYFILFALMMLITMMMTKFTWRKLVALLAVAVLVSFAGSFLTALFGAGQELSIQRIIELATSENYATTEDLGRFTAIPTLSKSIVTETSERLFGMGIGNCDTSAFAICNTPFFQTYEYLHYNWFSSAFLFLETGYVGLVMNLLFYLVVLILAIRKFKNGQGNKLFCRIAVVVALVCMILTFYNSALRKEVGYLAYFALALPFITGGANAEADEEEA